MSAFKSRMHPLCVFCGFGGFWAGLKLSRQRKAKTAPIGTPFGILVKIPQKWDILAKSTIYGGFGTNASKMRYLLPKPLARFLPGNLLDRRLTAFFWAKYSKNGQIWLRSKFGHFEAFCPEKCSKSPVQEISWIKC